MSNKRVYGPRFVNDKDRTEWDSSPHGTRDTLLIIGGLFLLFAFLNQLGF